MSWSKLSSSAAEAIRKPFKHAIYFKFIHLQSPKRSIHLRTQILDWPRFHESLHWDVVAEM